MANTANWVITSLECHTESQGQANVVSKIYYTCTLSSEDGYHTAVEGGFVRVQYEEGSPFTPYNSLTQEQILEWLWSSLNKEKVEEEVRQKLQNYITPPVVVNPLPWQQ